MKHYLLLVTFLSLSVDLLDAILFHTPKRAADYDFQGNLSEYFEPTDQQLLRDFPFLRLVRCEAFLATKETLGLTIMMMDFVFLASQCCLIPF